ncbi:hypothetical protein ElyMa_004732800 [Elysia marginata]|uniref:Uncharacterized protein n=1 Tax=Elysia marginata TaxID=1093978 RepID=A0AAV4IAK9_9GAST|nr:hypothetical protein ElyMa_004732800 [Elysia marginata]
MLSRSELWLIYCGNRTVCLHSPDIYTPVPVVTGHHWSLVSSLEVTDLGCGRQNQHSVLTVLKGVRRDCLSYRLASEQRNYRSISRLWEEIEMSSDRWKIVSSV